MTTSIIRLFDDLFYCTFDASESGLKCQQMPILNESNMFKIRSKNVKIQV